MESICGNIIKQLEDFKYPVKVILSQLTEM